MCDPAGFCGFPQYKCKLSLCSVGHLDADALMMAVSTLLQCQLMKTTKIPSLTCFDDGTDEELMMGLMKGPMMGLMKN